jgi:deoxyribodipyrimidine photo-lyase
MDMLVCIIMSAPVVVWFRLDLRLADNPALAAAAARGKHVVPAFIWAPEEEGEWPPGAASRWWLHQSLQSLDAGLRRFGMRLILRRGPSLDALRALARESGADAVSWNRRYEPALRARDARIQRALLSDGLRVETFNSALLFEPTEIKNTSGKSFQVFTPFWRTCLSAAPDFMPAPAPSIEKTRPLGSQTLDDFGLEPAVDWAQDLRGAWQPGEAGALEKLHRFVDDALAGYPEGRDRPANIGTSRLSPHLHFGEISPRQVWSACARLRGAASKAFLRQLGWREFAHHLLYHFPQTSRAPLRPQFEHFPWRRDAKGLRAWKRGRTGYAMVDAGMRELWATGWMHNRVRMVVGSFLVKDLLLPWMQGARWFWDTLVDADLANNTLGWQWVAGCGADSAPYFRIFNPAAQAARFDPKGGYVRRWVPELGTSGYPPPVVDHAQARARALKALAAIKQR